MPHFDNTVTLGSILTIIGFLATAWVAVHRTFASLDRRAVIFEGKILEHSKLLDAHASRMEKQDDMLARISEQMQRIVGRLESVNPATVAEAAAQAMNVVRAAEVAALGTIATAAAAAAARLHP